MCFQCFFLNFFDVAFHAPPAYMPSPSVIRIGELLEVFIKNVSDLPSELQQRFTFIEVDALD